MDYRKPLQQLMRNLLPNRLPSEAAAAPPDFADTRPIGEADADPAPPRREPRRGGGDRSPTGSRRQPAAWTESSIELAQGTEIMEFPDDTTADLMDQYFAERTRRAA